MWTWSVGHWLGRLGVGWGRLGGPTDTPTDPTDSLLPQPTPNRPQPTPNRPNRWPTDHVHMVSPYFKGAESISGLGLPQFLGFWRRFGVETWSPDLGHPTLMGSKSGPQPTPN